MQTRGGAGYRHTALAGMVVMTVHARRNPADANAVGHTCHSLLFHVRTELRAQRLLGYQVHRAAQQVFNVELDTEVRP